MTLSAEPDFLAADGIALWRRIADQLRLDIAGGVLAVGERLPGEAALALRFGVNRHTVRAALKALEREGLVRARQGSGTFIAGRPAPAPETAVIERVSAGIAGTVPAAEGRLLGSAVEPATAEIAAALWLSPDALVTRMETLTLSGGRPVSRSTSWFSAERFPAIDAVYRELGSVAAALSHYDITDYTRRMTRLHARRADVEESRALGLRPDAIVMVAEGTDALPEGQPVEYTLDRFAADRVELVVLGE